MIWTADKVTKGREQQIGELLTNAREGRGLSLEEAQRTTSIHVYNLEALERGELEVLERQHGPVLARGFLMSYASFLGLDGQKLADRVSSPEGPSSRGEDDSPRNPSSQKGFFFRRRRSLLLALGALLTALVVSAVFLSSETSVGTEPQRVALILDANKTNGADSADSVMVTKIAQDDAGLLLIPRNTVVEVPDHGTREIADTLGLGGPDLIRRTTTKLTAVEIPYYVLIDAAVVKEVVDMMGGLQVNVQSPVGGRVFTDGPQINISPGRQTLNGDQVLLYLEGGDLPDEVERAERQRALLDTMFRRAFTVENLLSHPAGVYEVIQKTETNMGRVEALRLARGAQATFGESDASMQVRTIPGYKEAANPTGNGSQDSRWILDAQELPTALDSTIQ